MYKVKVEIEGIVPMLMNPPTDLTIGQITGDGGKKPTPHALRDDWVNKVYRTKKGDVMLPSRLFQGSLDRGMCSPEPIKSNKIKMTRQKAKGVLFVSSDATLSNGKAKIMPELHTNAISTINGLTIQYRPMVKEGWKAEFEILISQDWLTLDALKEGIVQSGICHGVGSWRPRFGRYKVNKLTKLK